MARANTETRYGSVAKIFHWLTALLILTAIPLGLVAYDWPYDTDADLAVKATLFSIHKTVGVAAFFVALARILWALTQPRPAPLHPDRTMETALAETVHWALYGALVLVPLSGWLHHAATTGFAPIWWPFGQGLPFVPVDAGLAAAFGTLHWLSTKVLMAALALHVAGALKHAVIDRDHTLRRMLPGSRPAVAPAVAADRRGGRGGLLAAAALWAAVVVAGAALSVPPREDLPADTVALAPVESEWEVIEGTLGLAIRQLGSAVEGRFGDWTAAIAFDPDAAGPDMGRVEVEVAIASLTLGSVAGQAMGPEFFDASVHPRAIFEARIVREGGAYVADGSLTIRGTSVPVRLPFSLAIEGGIAEAKGRLVLDRRDFGIGTASYGDETSLGFEVIVEVELTAARPSA